MHKYIKTDIEQGLKYLKVGIMNALANIESGEEKKITLNGAISLKLIFNCAKERGWNVSLVHCNSKDNIYCIITPDRKLVYIYNSIEKDLISIRVKS